MRHKTTRPLAERFWAKVLKTDGCWLWQANRHPDGYGKFYSQGQKLWAHRVAYELTYGPIPAGLHVLHQCDNRPCVNPAHLTVGTNADNVRDRVTRDRPDRTKHLSVEDVRAIRMRHITQHVPRSQLAVEFHCSIAQVRRIVKRTSRAGVTEGEAQS